jgi:hypothetical protein
MCWPVPSEWQSDSGLLEDMEMRYWLITHPASYGTYGTGDEWQPYFLSKENVENTAINELLNGIESLERRTVRNITREFMFEYNHRYKA